MSNILLNPSPLYITTHGLKPALMEGKTTALLKFNMWSTPQQGSMVNDSFAFNNSESDYISSGRTFELPSSFKPTDFILPLLFFNDSQIIHTMFFKTCWENYFCCTVSNSFCFWIYWKHGVFDGYSLSWRNAHTILTFILSILLWQIYSLLFCY